jgi:hypothetical protein
MNGSPIPQVGHIAANPRDSMRAPVACLRCALNGTTRNSDIPSGKNLTNRNPSTSSFD